MKFKLRALLKFPKRKKVRASTSRRALAARAMDYEEMDEPNMKLSRALLIVLVLHVVAVAGIIAFNSIKTHERPRVTSEFKAAATASPAAQASVAPSAQPKIDTLKSAAHPPAASSPATKELRKAIPVKPAEPVAEAGKTYTVVKGDNPVSIAKKLNVSYDELLAINNIDDPHKLQIGQKLRIPEKTAKKKSEE